MGNITWKQEEHKHEWVYPDPHYRICRCGVVQEYDPQFSGPYTPMWNDLLFDPWYSRLQQQLRQKKRREIEKVSAS